jgi:hypothetical protein
LKSALPEFVGQAHLVHALHQSGTETTVYFNRRPDDWIRTMKICTMKGMKDMKV